MPVATKGSQAHMQAAVAEPQALNAAIVEQLPQLQGRRIDWVSPVERTEYKEYFSGPFLDVLGLSALRSELRKFWPPRGPQWDALAKVGDRGVLLVEAKAHYSETPRPDRCKASPASRQHISSSLERVRNSVGVPTMVPPWTEDNYQVANRLAHLWWLREQGVDAHLVFLGFTESPDWPRDPLDPQGWSAHVAPILRELGLPIAHELAQCTAVVSLPAPANVTPAVQPMMTLEI